MNPQQVRERTRTVQQDVALRGAKDARFARELTELEETNNLREIDDDVEDVATLFEWSAQEHVHQLKNPKWFALFSLTMTVFVVGFVFLGNFVASLTVGMIGIYMFISAQQKPSAIRYRLLTEGIALNNVLYHYKDLDAFNIVYEPRNVKTVLVRINKRLAPLIYMEIGDADPVAIRDILTEFVREDIKLEEPLIDVWARRLRF